MTNIVNTNNGTEAQNKLFKYEYLPRSFDKSVYGVATMLVELFVPDSHRGYLEKNLKFSDAYGRYNSRIPTYLHNRPPQFVKHSLDSRFAAGEFTLADISSVNFQKGQFSVKSAANVNKKELVDFSSVEKLRKRLLDKIDTVKNTMYMVDDETTMSTALKQLENIQLAWYPLRISPVKKKLKITSTEYHQVFHEKLPLRRRWKKKTPKADAIFIEEDSNDDVDDDGAKRKVSCMFNDEVCCADFD